jgi:hypothetical protein
MQPTLLLLAGAIAKLRLFIKIVRSDPLFMRFQGCSV